MTLMPTYGPTRRNTGSPCISNELKESLMDDKNIDFTFYMRCLCSDQMNPYASGVATNFAFGVQLYNFG